MPIFLTDAAISAESAELAARHHEISGGDPQNCAANTWTPGSAQAAKQGLRSCGGRVCSMPSQQNPSKIEGEAKTPTASMSGEARR